MKAVKKSTQRIAERTRMLTQPLRPIMPKSEPLNVGAMMAQMTVYNHLLLNMKLNAHCSLANGVSMKRIAPMQTEHAVKERSQMIDQATKTVSSLPQGEHVWMTQHAETASRARTLCEDSTPKSISQLMPIEPDRYDMQTKQDWLLVEEAAFKDKSLYGSDVTRVVHWSDMSFDEFMDAGFITLYSEACQLRIRQLAKTPDQQFGFDGAVQSGQVWSSSQVKHLGEPVGTDSLGSFYSALLRMRRTRPHFHAYLVSTSGFTGVIQDSQMWNFTCVNMSTTNLLLSPEQLAVPLVRESEDTLHVHNLRKCQIEALGAMTRAFVDNGTFILGLPPGAGKTLTCILFCAHEAARRFTTVVVVSPQKAQVAQTKGRFDTLLTKLRHAYTSTLVDTDGSTNMDHVCSRSSLAGNVHYVHTTYMSAKKVAAALQTHRNNVLIIIDEAHRYTNTLLGDLMAAADSHILLSGTWCGISPSVIGDGDVAAWRYTMTIADAERAGIIVPQRFVLPCKVALDDNRLEMRAEFIATTTMRLTVGPCRHILYSSNVRQAQQLAQLQRYCCRYRPQSLH
eukprot:TRINITY_DN1753_c0_g1_i11.p1 TRINITY_DN1753_c0_g1~~TRINITY_DN1753_c0_g1_i11.p1  ORF type:complete len:565 (+),score=44.67 TRINITY_DN1753_c0_g1_i11:298-1992(+)